MEFWMFDTPLGTMAVGEEDGHITRVYLPNSPMPRLMPHKTPLLERAEGQIREYFDGRRQEFDLPLTFVGTDFQKKVWQALLSVPYGEVRSYGEIAAAIGKQTLCGKLWGGLPCISGCCRSKRNPLQNCFTGGD